MSYFARVPMRWREAVGLVRALIPAEVSKQIEPRFLIGVSPRFVGLHYADMAKNWPDVAAGGWTYDNCAHANLSQNSPDGKQTVVFPRPELYHDPIGTLLHECGHMFDEATGFSIAVPETTEYSRSNRMEAFAEAFEMLLWSPSQAWTDSLQSEAMRPLQREMGLLL